MSVVSTRAKSATLKDVAERAGVSTATVARVLHDKGYVAGETREAVEAAIRETGYSINAVAQGLRTQRTFTLGHILQSVAPNPFFAGVALGAEQEAAASGCGVVIYNTHGDRERERLGVETFIRRRVDAVLFTTVTDEENVALAARSGVPVVQVERVTPVPTHAVTIDNHRGSSDAVAHLIALGHRRIAFIGVDPNPAAHLDAHPATTGVTPRRTVERERLAGYLDAHAAAGLPVHDALVRLGGTYYEGDRAFATVRGLLALPAVDRPTAVYATCDMLAAGALQAIYAAGLRVPDDLSVIGFDDTYASHLTPPLTTVRQPMQEAGRAAARLALSALHRTEEPDEPRTERLSTSLVVRSSTGPPPAAP